MLLFTNKMGSGNFTLYFLNLEEFLLNHNRNHNRNSSGIALRFLNSDFERRNVREWRAAARYRARYLQAAVRPLGQPNL